MKECNKFLNISLWFWKKCYKTRKTYNLIFKLEFKTIRKCQQWKTTGNNKNEKSMIYLDNKMYWPNIMKERHRRKIYIFNRKATGTPVNIRWKYTIKLLIWRIFHWSKGKKNVRDKNDWKSSRNYRRQAKGKQQMDKYNSWKEKLKQWNKTLETFLALKKNREKPLNSDCQGYIISRNSYLNVSIVWYIFLNLLAFQTINYLSKLQQKTTLL